MGYWITLSLCFSFQKNDAEDILVGAVSCDSIIKFYVDDTDKDVNGGFINDACHAIIKQKALLLLIFQPYLDKAKAKGCFKTFVA